MIDFIPLDDYATVVSCVLLFFTLSLAMVYMLRPRTVVARHEGRNRGVVVWASACFALLLLLIGLRPISYAFGDMGNYYKHFLDYELGTPLADEDVLFEALLWLFAQFGTASLFFFVCAVLYLVPLLLACRRTLQQYWPLGFFFAAAQFDFYGYAVNGIRQGIAASIFVLALTYRGPVAWALLAASVGFHKSFLLPMVAYFVTARLRNPKYYFTGWILALVATSASGAFGDLIASMGFLSDRLDRYLNVDEEFIEQFSAVGYRPDFIIYGALPIAVGAYFVLRKRCKDEMYARMLNSYLLCNAVWLLVIRLPVSNRIAYLSWCFMGLVIAYPLVKWKALPRQNVVAGALLTGFSLFTFVSHW